MAIPEHGSDAASVLGRLGEFHDRDLRWKDGRAFSLAYYAGPEAYAVATEAYSQFSSENSLNTDAFPSLKAMQADVIGNVCHLLGGDENSVGVFTSGGTESILTAVKGARQWGRSRGITQPEMVLPTTAHAAFSKAAAYFDVKTIRVPVDSEYRADTEAMAASITPDTILLVGSAPTYPQGVIDPIAALGELAQEFDVLFHVDACMGFTMPFLEKLGLVGADWNFTVPGVTSISCDLHKFGYTAKGASVLAHRNKELRKHQFFFTSDWLGGLYGSPAILGTRSGGSVASAWAMQQYFGADGYLEITKRAYEARVKLEAGIRVIDGLAVRGNPQATLVAFGADLTIPEADRVDIYAVGDHLWANDGWYCDRQTPPDSLHCTVNAVHHDVINEFLDALTTSLAAVRASKAAGDRTRAYGTL
jgi:sphinganine-1-phosphate aldolase